MECVSPGLAAKGAAVRRGHASLVASQVAPDATALEGSQEVPLPRFPGLGVGVGGCLVNPATVGERSPGRHGPGYDCL
eukprot:14093496-Alexandrium_andersonii.AAC.1